MSISKIQKGDQVVVTSGAFRGHKGFITAVVNRIRKNGKFQKKVSVSELKQYVDYQKPNAQYNIPGQIRAKDRLIDSSNVSLLDEKGKISKVKISLDKSGKKTRVYKSTGSSVQKIAVSLEKKNSESLETEAKAVNKDK
jgi:large subunit ribosomal protein L24